MINAISLKAYIKKVSPNTFILIAIEVIRRGSLFIIGLMLARTSGKDIFGLFSYSLSFGTFLFLLSDFGISRFIIRELSRSKELLKNVVNTLIPLKIAISCTAFGIFVIAVYQLKIPAGLHVPILLSGIYLVIRSFKQSLVAIFISSGRINEILVTTVIQNTLLLFLAFSVYARIMSLESMFACMIISALAGTLISIALISKHLGALRLLVDIAFYKSILKDSLPFAQTAILATLHTKVSVLCLGTMKGFSDTAVFSAADNFTLTLLVFITVFGTSIAPTMSSYCKHAFLRFRSYLRSTLIVVIGLSIFMALTINLFSRKIVTFFYGMDFAYSANALNFLIWSLLFLNINVILGIALESMDKAGLVPLCQITIILVTLLLNLYLIPGLGVLGACLATLLGNLVGIFLLGFFVRKNIVLCIAKDGTGNP